MRGAGYGLQVTGDGLQVTGKERPRAVPFVTFFCVLGKKFLCHGAGWGSVLF
jgi:hypothetical protein